MRRCRRPKNSRCSIGSMPGSPARTTSDPVAVRLRAALAERSLSPQHAQDLLAAFKLDVTKLRYRDWDDLIGYCSLSAMPVGRFVSTSTARAATSGRPTMRCAPRCRSSIICRIARKTIAISTASTFRSMRSPPRHHASKRSARARVAGAARLPARACRTHRTAAVRERRLSPPRSTTGGSASKSRSSTRWRIA